MKKKILAIITLVIAMLAMTFSVLAEEQQADFYYNDEVQDIAINITYEVDDLSFTIISPDGQEITKDTDTENVAVSFGSTLTMVLVNDAAQGQWSIKFDKGSNESIGISAGAISTNFWITEYTIGALAENQLPVEFSVSGDENERYEYTISLVTDETSIEGKELTSGWANANELQSVMVDMTEANTYSEYYLLLYVSNEYYFDYAYSDVFSYTNENSPDKLTNVDVTVYHDLNYVNIDWGDYTEYGWDSVVVEYSVDGEKQYDEEIFKNEKDNADYSYDDGSKILSFNIYVEYDGLLSSAYNLEVNLEKQDGIVAFTFPENGVNESNIWSFDYENADKTYTYFDVNGQEYEYELDGSGSKYFSLEEDNNIITVNYTDQNGIAHVYSRIANVSVVSPILQLSKDIDGVITENDSIIIAGKTNAPEIVINDEVVNVEDGIFSYKFMLAEGNNSISIIAKLGGKEAVLKASVIREIEEKESVVPKSFPIWIVYLVIGILISVVGIVLLIKVDSKKNPKPETEKSLKKKEKKAGKKDAKKQKKAEKKSKKKAEKNTSVWTKVKVFLIIMYILMWIGDVALWVWYITRTKFEDSVDFIHLAYDSLKEAKQYMELTDRIQSYAIILIVVNIVAILIVVAIKFILKIRASKQMDLSTPMEVPEHLQHLLNLGQEGKEEEKTDNKGND